MADKIIITRVRSLYSYDYGYEYGGSGEEEVEDIYIGDKCLITDRNWCMPSDEFLAILTDNNGSTVEIVDLENKYIDIDELPESLQELKDLIKKEEEVSKQLKRTP